jgi:hypothetical protein
MEPIHSQEDLCHKLNTYTPDSPLHSCNELFRFRAAGNEAWTWGSLWPERRDEDAMSTLA